MNRREFLEMLGMAAVGGAVVYSFPSVIVPKNIVQARDVYVMRVVDDPEFGFGFSGFQKEIYPTIINDLFFDAKPQIAFMKSVGYIYDAQNRIFLPRP